MAPRPAPRWSRTSIQAVHIRQAIPTLGTLPSLVTARRCSKPATGRGRELWVTDGTAAGTSLVKDINPGGYSSYPGDITAIGNGKALFSANDGTHGYELWVTDGTAGGTSLVEDINPGSAGSHPYNITALGDGKALFSANDGTYGYELWVTDGTQAG